MIGEQPLCVNCIHFHFEDTANFTCDAYPDGVPEPIILNTADHRQPYPGDHALTYSPIDPNYEIPDALKS